MRDPEYEISNLLYEARTRLSRSEHTVSRMIRVPPIQISGWETGTLPPLDKAEVIAKAYGLDPSAFLERLKSAISKGERLRKRALERKKYANEKQEDELFSGRIEFPNGVKNFFF